MASPAFRSSTIPGAGSSTGRTVTKPAGVVDNDILVCFAYVESDVTITPPSGWTQKLLNEQNAGGEDHRLYCWWHRAASDGASYAWSWSGSVFNDFSVHAFSGALTSGDPFQQTNTAINTTSAAAATPAVSLTTTTADTTLIWAGSNFQSNSWDTDPASFAALYDASYARCFYKSQAAAGASGSITCNNNVAAFQTAMLLSLASIADSGGGTNTQKTMTDTVVLADAALDPVRRVRQMSETVALTDSTVLWRRLKRVADETITTIDSVVKSVIQSGGAVYTKVMTETLNLADTGVRWLRRVRGPIDTITLSDGDTYRSSLVTATDSVDVSDNTVSWRRLKRLLQESLEVVDAFSKLVAGASVIYTKVMTEALILSDAAIRWLRRVRVPTDTLEVSDDLVRWQRLKRVVTENFDVIDAFSKTIAGAGIVYAKVMSDTVTLIDDAGQRWKLRTSQLTDTVGVSDAVRRALARIRILGEVVEFSDGVVKVQRLVRSVDESVEITDGSLSTLILDRPSSVQFAFGSSSPPFRFGGM